jgi:hypothetical protein
VSVLGDEVESLVRAHESDASELAEWRRRAQDAERTVRAVREAWDAYSRAHEPRSAAIALRAHMDRALAGAPISRTTRPSEES